MRELLKAAMKNEPCDTVFRGGRIANVYTLEFEEADVAVKSGVIVGVGSDYEAKDVIDCAGKILLPGFIEGHMHVESTCLTPRSLAAELLPLGTTTAMPDPHEIANTCGAEGVRFMKQDSEGLPVDFYYGAPSCVPASGAESPFKELGASDLGALLDEGACTHLGEMMNFPGVISGDEAVWAKLERARGLVITGHAPGLSGAALCAYIMGGPTSDHECTSKEEAIEKLRRGMYLMIRQGACEKNLAELAPLIRENPMLFCRCMAVSDDITADSLKTRGHLNAVIKELIAERIDPLIAVRMVTLTPAEYFRLPDRGGIAPGKIADIVIADNIQDLNIESVWKRGVLTARNGSLLRPLAPSKKTHASRLQGAKKISVPSAEMLRVPAPAKGALLNMIGIVPGNVCTKHLKAGPHTENGFVTASAELDIAKMAVVEKNKGTGRTAVGFVKGFGLPRGAIASSIAHDAHNYTCIGMDDVSMAAALENLARMGGGIIVTEGEKVLAKLELPIGGLMSDMPAGSVRLAAAKLFAAAEALGCVNPQPFMQMSFLSLSVIPELKLTDKGYFSISGGGYTPLFN